MTNDELSILNLIRENAWLKCENEELKRNQLNAKTAMQNAGVPSYFEDGNSSDDLSFMEQVSILCDMYQREKDKKHEQTTSTLRP